MQQPEYAIVTIGWTEFNYNIQYRSEAFLSAKLGRRGFKTIEEARDFANEHSIQSHYRRVMPGGFSTRSVKFYTIDEIETAQARPGQLMGIANIKNFTYI